MPIVRMVGGKFKHFIDRGGLAGNTDSAHICIIVPEIVAAALDGDQAYRRHTC